MDCPRCKLMLSTTDYEGVQVDLCDNCWGIWLDQGELKQVIDTRDMQFSAEERRQLTDLRAQSAQEENNDPAACPHCGKIMTQVHADAGIHLVIDRCPEHGVWLDTGEIKAVQAVAETSAQLHRLLIAKLGLIPR
jgi:Zn-finger nucleic acid-binding protein